jgi:hemerythrin-like domain-containing protein
MIDSSRFKHEHKVILGIVSQLEDLLDAEALAANGTPAHQLVAELAGLLTEHLRVEDAVIYPSLVTHSEPSVRATAQLLAKRIGGIGRTFEAYVGAWAAGETISGDPARFVAETRGMMRALKNRIEREDRELYPLVDRFS